MKKAIIYSIAVLAMVGLGSCTKDAATDFLPTAGHYTLDCVSGSLDAESRTSLDLENGGKVAWSAEDRIAVINTATNAIYEYVLSDGADTYNGKFTPVATAATFDDAADIKAVYPAAAATVASGAISLALNAAADKTSFAENDIKVSTTAPTVTSGETSASVNFGFKQLGTWCRFVFDMTGNADYARESIESVTVTTTAGATKISGTAAIDFTGEIPAMGAGTETSVMQTLAAAQPLSEPVTVNFMLLPAITRADQLKITVVTDIHTFVFFATPTKDFTTGSTLRFPITITRFTEAATRANFTYVATRNAAYYYGKANCLLLANNATSGTLDVQPYEANESCEMLSTDKVAAIATAAKAEVVWCEKPLTLDCALDGNNLNITNADGYGNALVAIKDADDNILWSYHVWRPESDPTQTLEYKNTKSGTYNVMPMALGATKVVTLADVVATKVAGCGLYYQWGRKDPLGRLASLAGDATYVAVNGTEPGGRQHLNDLPLPSSNEDRYMIDFATKNPTKFISVQSGTYYDDWAAKPNPNLWANPKGYEYPTLVQVKKSIYDPCPAGYHVVPIDLWENFSTEDYLINVDNIHTTESKDWVNEENGRGYAFYYEGNKTDGGKTDFYPAMGHRDRQKGSHKYLGVSGYYWSSAPVAANGINCYFLSFSANGIGLRNNNRHAFAMPLRCVKEE